MKETDEQHLTERTIKIIERNGRILLRKKRAVYEDGTVHAKYDIYMHQHSDIAGGPDKASWCYRKSRNTAKEFHNLKWAHTIAPLYNCVVVVVYPKGK